MGDGVAGESPLVVERTVVEGRDRVAVRGELDAFTAPELRASIDNAESDDVELDLGGVSFIDSSGLATVVESHQRLEREDRRLVIVDRSDIVQRLLDLSGLSERLHQESAS
ncbi:MAG: STAS domain-containing protein [Acidimicrobiales bacterium]